MAQPRPAAANDEPLRSVRGVDASAGGPRDAASEQPWPGPPRRKPCQWVTFERYANALEGSIVAGRLEAEGVPVIVEPIAPSFDLQGVSILWVPKELVHRARWVLAWPPPSDAELAFLATGEMDPAER